MSSTNKHWAIILGGSSGFGLATAKKLSAHGMNICIVHRDRKGAMAKIQPEFDKLSARGVKIAIYNTDALAADNIKNVLQDLKKQFTEGESIKLLMHSIAHGNLKLLTKTKRSKSHQSTIEKLAQQITIQPGVLQEKINSLFNQGYDELVDLASPPEYNQENFLSDEDFTLTIHSMGTSLATWVRAVFDNHLFSEDARVLSLTSEGNEINWQGYAAVSAAKVALEAVSRAIAVEYAPYGIRSNVIQAGITDTPALRMIPGNLQMKAKAKQRNPFKRLTQPEDVANFIYLMCQPEACWANGNVIRIDGGEHISG